MTRLSQTIMVAAILLKDQVLIFLFVGERWDSAVFHSQIDCQ